MYHIHIQGRIDSSQEWDSEKTYPLLLALEMIDYMNAESKAFRFSLGPKVQ